jgi:SAM-dependent methyltransferase
MTPTEETGPPSPPSPWIGRHLALAPAGGLALDLAAGGGRPSRLLLARGFRVVAVDREVSGLADLAGEARFEAVAAELEGGAPWPLEGRRFDLITVANYLHRPLFPAIRRSLAPGGVLLYETFAVGNERFGRPRNPDFLLRPGELLAAFADLQVVAYEHGIDEARPAVRQRLAAVEGSEPRPTPPPG